MTGLTQADPKVGKEFEIDCSYPSCREPHKFQAYRNQNGRVYVQGLDAYNVVPGTFYDQSTAIRGTKRYVKNN